MAEVTSRIVMAGAETRAVLVDRQPVSPPSAQFEHSLAVIIGIDAYGPGIPRLRTAVNDAARLAELLAAAHGYETILLTGQETGEQVSRERLRNLFSAELPTRLGQDDRLLFYFAGHGVALDGDDGPSGYLVPQDARPDEPASMLPMTDLHAWLTALPCRHLIAILDCCFAGAFRWASTRHIGALPEVIHQERYDRYLRSPAWQVLTSAAHDQKALDVLGGNVLGRREAQGRHSPFAQALIAALEKGEADLVPRGEGDGVITATELYLYLREQVEVQAEAQVGHQQTPGLWPLKKHRKGEFIFLAPGHVLNLPPAPELTGEANPYRGLKSYDQRHTQLFFGREDEIRELAVLVDRQPFVAVLGASGTGKSSLVKAGLLPRLQVESGKLQVAGDEGAAPYHVLAPMRPTDQPLRSLAALLRAELNADPSGFGNPKGLARDDRALAEVVARWAQAHPGQRLVLTIDQFEELATLCRDDAERERFLCLLAAAVQQQPAAFRLIITLRTDFEPQFTQEDSPLAKIWEPGRYVVPPMDIEDLRQVIEGPASVRVLYFEPPELVDDLIKEVVLTPGALPLLSFTLSELYVKYVRSGRDDRALSGADYQALGGVVGSLRNRATEEYDALPDDTHRATMQRVMLRMVAVEGGELARRRVALSELDYPTEEENARVQTVLDRLVEARLLVRGTSESPDGTTGEAHVEPAHDALVLAWDKLLRWKKEAEEYLPLQRRLAQAASEWSKATREDKPGLLWDDDPRLPQLEGTLWPTSGKPKGLAGLVRWAKQVFASKREAPADTKWLNGAEFDFVQASVSRRASTLRRIISITAAIMVSLVWLTIFAGRQAKEATLQRNEANVQRDNAIVEKQRAEAASLLTAGESVFSQAPLLGLRLVLDGLLRVPGEDAQMQTIITNTALKLAQTGRVLSFGRSVTGIYPSANGSVFVITYADMAGELRRTSDGMIVTVLTGIAERAFFGADARSTHFAVHYSESTSDGGKTPHIVEVRQITDGLLVSSFQPDISAREEIVQIYFEPYPTEQFMLIEYVDPADEDLDHQMEVRSIQDARQLIGISPVEDYRLFPSGPNHRYIMLCDDDDCAVHNTTDFARLIVGSRPVTASTDDEARYIAFYDDDAASEIETSTLFDTVTGKEVTGLKGSLQEVFFSRNPRSTSFAVTYKDDRRRGGVWGELLRIEDLRPVAAFTAQVEGFSFSAPGQEPIVVVDYVEAPGEVYSLVSGQLLAQLNQKGQVQRVYWSARPEGRYFGVSYSGDSGSWPDNELRQVLDGQLVPLSGRLSFEEVDLLALSHKRPVRSEYFYVDVGAGDKTSVQVRSLATCEVLGTLDSFPLPHVLLSDYYSDDFIVVQGHPYSQESHLYGLQDGKVMASLPDVIWPDGSYFSPDPEARYAVFTYSNYKYYGGSRATELPRQLYDVHHGEAVNLSGAFKSVQFSYMPESRDLSFVVNYDNNRSELWTAGNGPVYLADLGISPAFMFFGPGNQHLVVRYSTGEAYLIDVEWLKNIRKAAPDSEISSANELLRLACPLYKRYEFNLDSVQKYLFDSQGVLSCR